MSPDEELMLIFGAMHILALVLGGVLFAMFLRSETVTPWQDRRDEEEDGGGGGGNDRIRRPSPSGTPGDGVPLPDAAPARVRLRDGHGRLERPAPQRRTAREPGRAPARQR